MAVSKFTILFEDKISLLPTGSIVTRLIKFFLTVHLTSSSVLLSIIVVRFESTTTYFMSDACAGERYSVAI